MRVIPSIPAQIVQEAANSASREGRLLTEMAEALSSLAAKGGASRPAEVSGAPAGLRGIPLAPQHREALLSLMGEAGSTLEKLPDPDAESFAVWLNSHWALPQAAGRTLWNEVLEGAALQHALARPRLSLASRGRSHPRHIVDVGAAFWGSRWEALTEVTQVVIAPGLETPFVLTSRSFGCYIAFPTATSADPGLLGQFIHETAHVDAFLRGIDGVYPQELEALSAELSFLRAERCPSCEWGFWKAVSVDAPRRLENELLRLKSGENAEAQAPFLDAVYVWAGRELLARA